jgi:hypothetical protein
MKVSIRRPLAGVRKFYITVKVEADEAGPALADQIAEHLKKRRIGERLHAVVHPEGAFANIPIPETDGDDED